MRDIFQIIEIHTQKQEKYREFQGEILASLHNNGHPYDGKTFLSRKDFVRLSWDIDDQDDDIDYDDMQAMMKQMNDDLIFRRDGN